MKKAKVHRRVRQGHIATFGQGSTRRTVSSSACSQLSLWELTSVSCTVRKTRLYVSGIRGGCYYALNTSLKKAKAF